MKPAPKRPDARARLVEYMDLWMSIGGTCTKGRRLLRAHERDIALRAAAIGANAASASDHRAVYDAIRAAILGAPRPAGRGKKGAKP